ncbi:hypothetical protein [unidentified bacterial endosymbiont]|uniref:hypothetical protein n=1 Tax=unidentified bacterial endosymbiont TaxID=2355 RepID=UPI0020A04416|nr:hypothetical protein [unidentified bacterial endosymbiont]
MGNSLSSTPVSQTNNTGTSTVTSATKNSSNTTHLSVITPGRKDLIEAFADLAESEANLRNLQYTQAVEQSVNATGAMEHTVEHERDAANKTMKGTMLGSAGEIAGGLAGGVSQFLGFLGDRGIGEKNGLRRRTEQIAKGMSGDEQIAFTQAHRKELRPHRKLSLMGRCAEPISQLVSQPFKIGGSILSAGAKKMETTAELTRLVSNQAQSNAKECSEQGKNSSGFFSRLVSIVAGFAQNLTRALAAIG